MKRSKIMILLLVVAMILTLSAVSAADTNDTSDSVVQAVDDAPLEEVASDDVDAVAATDDAEVLTADDGTNFTSLKNKIATHEGSGPILIDKDYTRVAGEEDILIDNGATLVSTSGNSINAANLGGIFKVKSGVTLYLSGLTLVNGKASDGGAIYNEGKIIIVDCTFRDNTATNNGGAIYNLGNADISATSEFIDNAAAYRGGAIYNDEGTLTVKTSTFDNNNLTFRNSGSEAYNGGAAIYNNAGSLTLDDVDVINHITDISPRAGEGGDKIDAAVMNYNGNAVVNNSYFANNKGSWGGALYTVGKHTAADTTLTVENTVFNGNRATFGAAIYIENANLKLDNGTFIDNVGIGTGSAGTASTQGGAVLIMEDTDFTTTASANIRNSKFEGNKAQKGGAVSFATVSGESIVDNCEFINNDATTFGGAIRANMANGATLAVNDSTFDGNTAPKGSAIYNQYKLSLSGNTITGSDAAIVSTSTGEVTSEINVDILNHGEYPIYDNAHKVTANVTDDNGNVLADLVGFKFVTDGANVEAIYNASTKLYEGLLVLPAPGIYTINATYIDEDKLTVQTAILKNFKGTFQDLQNKVNNCGGVLDLTYDFAYTPELGDTTSTGILVSNNLIINGNGHTISGSNAARIFNVTAETTINNIKLIEGSAAEFGGAIYTTADLTVINSTFDNNNIVSQATTGEFGGSAIFSDKGTTLTIKGSNFTNNNKDYVDGEQSYGAVAAANNVLIEDSYFTNNYARWGGAVTVVGYLDDANIATLTINNTKFENNKADRGGAVFSQAAHLVVDDSIFNNNEAYLRGGAILSDDYHNNLYTTTITDSSFDSNNATEYGSAIVQLTSFTYTGCNFTNNKAPTGTGAIHYMGSTGDSGFDDSVITNCRFEDNSANYYGAIYFYGTKSLDVVDSQFINNDGGNVAASGAIFFVGKDLTIIKSNFTGNDGNGSYGYAGAVYYSSSTGELNIDQSKFTDNTGGWAGAVFAVSGNAKISNSEFSGNTGRYANAILTSTSLSLENNTINSDKADVYAYTANGVITSNITVVILNGETVTMAGKKVITAKITDDNGNVINGANFKFDINGTELNAVYTTAGTYQATYTNDVPGIYVVNITYPKEDNLVIKTATLINIKGTYTDLQNQIDKAIEDGVDLELAYNFTYNGEFDSALISGIVIDHDVTINGNGFAINGNDIAKMFEVDSGILTLNNMTLCNGASQDSHDGVKEHGGAIYVKEGAALVVENVAFINNTAISHGGAIYSLGDVTVKEGSKFINNTAGTWGGAIYVQTNLNVTGATFTENTAGHVAGAISVSGDQISIKDSSFTKNKALSYDSGAVKIANELATTIISSTDFIENSAATSAGALTAYGGNLVIKDNCKFIDNTAVTSAGAIYTYGNVEIADSEFVNNNAADGGAIYYNINGNLTVTGSNFTDNTANYGGAIENEGFGILTASDCNFTNNTATVRGGAIISSGNTSVSDSVFADNKATDNSNAIYLYVPNTTLQLSNNEISGSDDAQILVKNGAQVISPLNVTILDNGTYNITTSSPYNITAVVTDLKGNLIVDDAFRFVVGDNIIDNIEINATTGVYTATFTPSETGSFVVSTNLEDTSSIETAVLNIFRTFSDLQTLIDADTTGSITLNGDYIYNEEFDSALTKGIVINKDITINGNGYTIDGNNMQHIFSIYNGDVALDNITFANSVCNDGVGAVYTNTSLTVANSVFVNNTATNNYANGAAIMAEATGSEITLNIHNTVFKDNTIDNGGAAVTVATPDDKQVIYNIYDSTFENNVAINTAAGANVAGGAIFSYGKTKGYINNTQFINNKALSEYLANGGAIKVQFGGTLVVANSTFINNTAGHAGGAISVQANTGMDNTLTVDTCTFSGNTATDGGAAIASLQNVGESDVTVLNSEFDESNAVHLDGKTTAKVSDSVFTGAENAITSLGNLTLANNTISSVIINNGTINGIVTVLAAQTVNVTYKQEINLTATFTDDKGNLIYDADLAFMVEGDSGIYNATYDNGVYTATYVVNVEGIKNVTATNVGDVATIVNGLLNVSKVNTTLTVNTTDIIRKDPENITVTLLDIYGNPVIDANVRVIVTKGMELLNDTTLKTDADGMIKFTLLDLAVGDYNVVAIYMGDTRYNEAESASNVFNVKELNYTSTFTELQDLINAYEGTNQTLVLPYDFTYNSWTDEDKYANGVLISKDIVIDGNGTTLDINKTYRIFTIAPGITVTIKNLTFINGNATEGAAIYTEAEKLTLENCNFFNNDPVCGGAVFVKAGETLTVESLFENNTADYGGAIYVDAGASLTVNGTTFNNNKATVGGAIYALGNVTVIGSTFTANEAMGAGAIYVLDRASDVTLTVTDSTFKDNVAGDAGAGILIDASEGYSINYAIENSEFTNNGIATTTSIACGGAIYSEGNAIGTVKGSNFTANKVVSDLSSGGAIRVQYEGVATIEDCTFTDNLAYAGAAIGLQANTGKTPDVTVIGCTFKDNEAQAGAAIAAVSNVGESKITVINSTFESNNASVYGGAIFGDKATTITVSGSNFTANEATEMGGAICSRGNLIVSDSTFTNNVVGDGGAAIAVDGRANVATYDITGSTFDKNTIDNPANPAGAGGAFYAVGTTEGTIADSVFTENSVSSNGYANGGAIKIELAGKATIKDSTFESNGATVSGGAIDLQSDATGYPDVTVINCNFTSNGAQAGGAIASLSNVGEATLTIINSTFTDNVGTVAGGAVYSDKSTKTTISGSKFIDNAGNLGGAVYALKELTVNEGTSFEDNAAELGGAIYVAAKYDDANLVVKDVTFTNNFVNDGGAAIAIKGDGKVATYDISDSTFDNNTMYDLANPAGCGAVYIVGTSEGTFTNDVFTNNSATSDGLANGGAIKLEFGAKATIIGSTFEDNSATVSGGAIDLQSDVGMNPEATIINCTFNNNVAQAGGAIACLENPNTGSSSVTVEGSHFNGNVAGVGGAIYSDDFSTVTVTGSDFTANEANNGAAIYSLNELTVTDSEFTKNAAEGGAAIFVADKYTAVNLVVDGCTFTENTVTNAGGAILIDSTYGNGVTYAVTGSEFTNNTATNSAEDACVAGGAIYMEGVGASGAINNDVFTGNKVNSPLFPNGGAIKVQFGAVANIANCTFEANEAGLTGGAIDVQANTDMPCVVDITGCTFTNNKAPAGAAIAALQNVGTSGLFIDNSTFDANEAELAGIVYIDDLSTAYIGDSVFTANVDPNDAAIYNIGNLALNGNTIDTVIYNGGNITSQTYIRVLDNSSTELVNYGDEVLLYAVILDDNNNTIITKGDLAFTVEGDNGIYNATFNTTNNRYEANYTVIGVGNIVVSATFDDIATLGTNTVQTGIISVAKANITEFYVATNEQGVFNYGENATITIHLEGVNGELLNDTLKLVVNDTEYPVTLINGTAIFNIGLAPGEYSALAIFEGNDKYNGPEYASDVFKVMFPDRILEITGDTIEYGETAVVNITIRSSDDADWGTVVLVVNGAETRLFVDGNATVEFTGLTVGTYNITATLLKEELANEIVNDTETIVVNKAATTIVFIYDEINATIGEDVEVEYNILPSVDGGNVTLWIDGVEYYNGIITQATGSILILKENLTTDKAYNITIQYIGNENYMDSNVDEIVLNVAKVDISKNITVSGSQITYGENGTITVEFPSLDVEGNVTVTLIGVDGVYMADVEGGRAIVEIPGLAGNRTYELQTLVYSGDAKYAGFTSNDSSIVVEVAQAESAIQIITVTGNLTYPGSPVILFGVANLTSLQVYVIDSNFAVYYNETINGFNETYLGVVNVTGLPAGDYAVVFINEETENYKHAYAFKEFKVDKSPIEISVVALDTFVGVNTNVIVTVSPNAVGYVTILVNGKEYAAEINGTTATAEIDAFNLVAGENNVYVVFDGDGNYTMNHNTTTFIAYDNVVTNDTFFVYFDENGVLRDTVPFEELIFAGEFSDLSDYVVIDRALTITGEDAELYNIGFVIVAPNVVLNNMSVIADTSLGDLIGIYDDNVTVSDMFIAYAVGDEEAIAINVFDVENVDILDNIILFASNVTSDKSAMAINVEKSSDVVIDGNMIGTNITAVDSDWSLYKEYGMMGITNVHTIKVMKSEGVAISNNLIEARSSANVGFSPTTEAILVVDTDDFLFDSNDVAVVDEITPVGTPAYLYALTMGICDDAIISNNEFYMATEGGVDKEGTAYAIQFVTSDVEIIGNNITSVSNGPNLGIYVGYAMDYYTDYEYMMTDFTVLIEGNNINVTGYAANTSTYYALVSGIEINAGEVVVTDNIIAVYNKAGYVADAYVYGVSSAQSPNTIIDTEFTITDNTIIVEDADYAIGVNYPIDTLATGNYLIAHELYGDEAVFVNGTSGTVVDNFPAKLNLTITVENVTVGTPVVISITANDLFSGEVIVVIGANETPVELIDGIGSLTVSLPADDYTASVYFDGDTYFVKDENSTTFTVSRFNTTFEITHGTAIFNQPLDVAVALPGVTGDIKVTVDGKEITVSLVDGKGNFTIAKEDVTVGDHNITATFAGNDIYNPTAGNDSFTVESPKELNLLITVENVTVGTPVVFNITANVLFSGEVIVVIGANETPVELTNGIGSLTVSLPADDYTASVYFDGDSYFLKDENSTTFTVSRLNTTFEIIHGTPAYNEALDVTIILPGVTGDIKVSVDTKEITVSLVDGKGNFTIAKEDMTVGNHSISAVFDGNEVFNSATGNDSFTVNKTEDYEIDVNLTVGDIDAGENLTFNVTLPADADGNVTVYVNGTPVATVKPIDGVATVNVPADAFTPGENNVTVTYSGDSKYGDKSVSKTIVEKVPADLTASAADINVGQNATITINAPSDVTGTISVEVNGVTYTPVEGKVIIENLPAGNYTANVYLTGDAKYSDNTTTAKFAVNKVDINPETAINITTPENATAPVISVDLPEDATGTLDVDVDGKHTSVPIVNGKATAALPKLEPGSYNATITYNSNNSKYASVSTTVPINVTSNVPDSAFTIPTSAKSDEKTTFSIKLPTNATGHLDVYVNGKSYSALLENGTATVTVPAQSAGKYNVTVSYTGDDYYNSAVKQSVLTVTDPVFKITKNKNISPRYSAKASWKILVTRDGKAVGAGEKVTIKYNGKTYTVKTNSKGYATFKPSTKLKPKKYTVTATYKGAKVTNKITIKNIIKAKNKKVKKSKKVTKVKVSLMKVNGKYLKKKVLKIKFNKKTYKVKTNKKGVATWKVKKSMLKKLKVGKKYKYKVTYGKDVVTKKLTIKK